MKNKKSKLYDITVILVDGNDNMSTKENTYKTNDQLQFTLRKPKQNTNSNKKSVSNITLPLINDNVKLTKEAHTENKKTMTKFKYKLKLK